MEKKITSKDEVGLIKAKNKSKWKYQSQSVSSPIKTDDQIE